MSGRDRSPDREEGEEPTMIVKDEFGRDVPASRLKSREKERQREERDRDYDRRRGGGDYMDRLADRNRQREYREDREREERYREKREGDRDDRHRRDDRDRHRRDDWDDKHKGKRSPDRREDRDLDSQSKRRKNRDDDKDEFEAPAVDLENLDGDDAMALFARMGLPMGFDSTKGKQVEGNDAGAVKTAWKRKFRQYQNRGLHGAMVQGEAIIKK